MTTEEAPPTFAPQDDAFHFAGLGDDWWATETSWFSFHDPARRLGGWFYTLARPNVGSVQGGVWVWDDTTVLPWEALYSTNYSTLQIPLDTDLRNATLPTGVGIKVLEPTNKYALTYDDPGRLVVDLVFEGIMPPEPMRSVKSTFGKARHFDQFGRVTGHIVVNGERVAIDCLAARDRTWGRRREDRPHKAAYVTGCASAEEAFLAVTSEHGGREAANYGFLRRKGITVPLVGGERRVRRNAEHGLIEHIEMDFEDESGRSITVTGTPVNRIILNRHTFIDVNSLVRWDMDGLEAWGEDQDMWPVHDWADFRRAARGGAH